MSISGREGRIAYPCNNCDYVTNNWASLDYHMSHVHMPTKQFFVKQPNTQTTREAQRQSPAPPSPLPRPYMRLIKIDYTKTSSLLS